jgi:hypothetical protein
MRIYEKRREREAERGRTSMWDEAEPKKVNTAAVTL